MRASMLSRKVLVYILEVFLSASSTGIDVPDSVGNEINNDARPVNVRGVEGDTEPVELENGTSGNRKTSAIPPWFIVVVYVA